VHNIYCIATVIVHLWISPVSAVPMGHLLGSIIFIAPFNRHHRQPAEHPV
jgi:hypothetical protein